MTQLIYNSVNDIVATYGTKREREAAATAINSFLFMERQRGEGLKISSSKDLHTLLAPYFMGLEVEHFYLVCLNKQNKVISIELINTGIPDACIVDLQKLYKLAINTNKCSAAIIAHNHPSGSNKPSREDVQLTEKIKKGFQLFDIILHDSYIYSNLNTYYSFSDEGIM